MLENDLIDLQGTTESMGYMADLSDKIEQTKITYIQSYKVSQILSKPEKLQSNESTSFLYQDYHIILLILIGFISFIFIYLFFISFKRINLRSAFFNFSTLTTLKFKPKISILSKLFLSYLIFSRNLFLWINLVFLSNDIKTDTSIVNTDEFINSVDQLLETPKILVFPFFLLQLFSKAPKNSFLSKLYYKKVLKQKFFKISPGSKKKLLSKYKMNDLFFFSRKEVQQTIVLVFSDQLNQNNFFFMKPTIYYEAPATLYYRKNLKKSLKKQINNW